MRRKTNGLPFSTCADLYHQRMRYSGLDIANITLGSSCDARLVNNYSYDALHRITAMHNSLIRPGLAADNAYSTSYSYDPAGNIQHLSRRGFVGMSGATPVYDLIDDLHYSYANANPAANAFSSKLQGVDDVVTDAAAQPRGVFLPSSGYGYDGNGNMIGAGSVTAEYNILNLPTKLSTSSGTRKFEYVFGGGKYSAELITGNPAIDEMRHYIGGMEFKNGILEAYNFGDGRVVFHDSVPTLRFQYRLHDHLGNTVVFFEDKNADGCIKTEDQATSQADLEIVQRLLYYPFGMALEGLGAWNAQPWQQYRYNGKERDTLTGWYDYSARWYLDGIGRFPSVDPLADWAPGWTPYRYGFNNPISFIDPDGLFESKAAARDYAKDHGVRIGLFSRNRIVENSDGLWSIENKNEHTSTYDLGGDFGVVTAVLIRPRDIVNERYEGNIFLGKEHIATYRGDGVTDGVLGEHNITPHYGMPPGGGRHVQIAKAVQAVRRGTTVYTSVSKGVTQYAGITDNVARRAAQHIASKGIDIQPLMQNLSRADARAVEQALIEIHGLAKNGGTLLNRINSISPQNPQYGAQLQRGYHLLKSIGY
jgi:RHS repeat-associated protein